MNSFDIFNLKSVGLFYGDRKTKIYRSEVHDTTIRLFAKRTGSRAKCPSCMKSSSTVRSCYVRTLADLPLAVNAVQIRLEVRRFSCNNPACKKHIFSERFNGLTEPYSRRTIRVSEYLRKFLIEVSSNKGAYFSRVMNIPVSSNTCLRIVKSMTMPESDKLLCIGIDDWAKRKGMNYGTIIVNAETGRPIDLLDSRDSSDVVEWLSHHKEIKYITRDRAAAYTSAIRKAIPDAKQIADRFHLVKNLGDAIQEEIKQEYIHLKKVSKSIHERSEILEYTKESGKELVNTKRNVSKNIELMMDTIITQKDEKFSLMMEMKKDGHSISEIARKTETNWRTVKKYLEQGMPSTVRSTRVNYEKYINEIKHMCSLEINPTAMYRSLKNIGLKCCTRSFTSWFSAHFPYYEHKWNRTYPEPLKFSKHKVWPYFIPMPKILSIYVTNPEYGVSKDTGECSMEKEIVDSLVSEVPLLSNLRTLYTDFKNILKSGDPDQLGIWIEQAQTIGRKKLDRFCKGLQKDIIAVKNAISYNWTNGLVEGNVNRLKNKKREMYGRCGFELLRRKVCLSQTG